MSTRGTVLFVDDESKILRSLRRSFFQAEFDCRFSESALDALTIIESEPIDILVTDIRMPHMDGLQLLKIVRDKHPAINRIVLSGFVEQKAVMSALNSGLASTYFAKPWEDKVLYDRLVHILGVRSSLKDRRLLNMLGRLESFPTFPGIYMDFIEAVEQERAISEITQIIERDVTASAKILKVANSAFFGAQKVNSLSKAVVKIGLLPVKNVILTLSIISNMKWKAVQVAQLEEIFLHSFLVNRYVGRFYRMQFGSEMPPRFSSLGIVHDIGKIILLQYLPDQYERILLHMRTKHPDFYTAEIALGFEGRTHSEIGAYFIDHWNLPELFVETSLFHHRPEETQEDYRDIMRLLNFTDRFVHYVTETPAAVSPDFDAFDCADFAPTSLLELSFQVRKDMLEREFFW